MPGPTAKVARPGKPSALPTVANWPVVAQAAEVTTQRGPRSALKEPRLERKLGRPTSTDQGALQPRPGLKCLP